MQKINFIPVSTETQDVFDRPIPASQAIPEWYKQQSGYTDGHKLTTPDGKYNHTIKHCMPAFDAMTAGYIIPLPQDIEVESDENGIMTMRWPSDMFQQFSSHSTQQVNNLPIDEEVWDPTPWKFHNPWIIQTPPGYSCLFVQPMWHDHLPFRCFSGVVDTDVYNMQPVNFPCLFRRGFRGAIPMGTPMIQVIPFKREEWKSKTLDPSTLDSKKWKRSERRFGHRYKKDYRQKKRYR